MVKVKHIQLRTFADITACDPLPTTFTERFDGKDREDIVREVSAKYGKDLFGLVIYDRNIITVDGVQYESEKLNQQPWSALGTEAPISTLLRKF